MARNKQKRANRANNSSQRPMRIDTIVKTGFTQNPPPVQYVTAISKVIPVVRTGGTTYTLTCNDVLTADSIAYGLPANTFRYTSFRVNWVKCWGPVGKSLALQSLRSNGSGSDYNVIGTDNSGLSTERPRVQLVCGIVDQTYMFSKTSLTDPIATAVSPPGTPAWVAADSVVFHIGVTFLA